jgi:hypothetical protein
MGCLLYNFRQRFDARSMRGATIDVEKKNARRDATPQRAHANFWWRELYQFARLTAMSAGAIKNLMRRLLDGYRAQQGNPN